MKRSYSALVLSVDATRCGGPALAVNLSFDVPRLIAEEFEK